MDFTSLQHLQQQPTITKSTVKKLLRASDAYAQLVLQRLETKGVIRRVTRGIYTSKDNIYEICSHLDTPSYLSLSTAAMLKGHTEQIITTVQVMATKNKEFIFDNYLVKLIKTPYLFGYEKTRQPELFIARDEKLLLDMLIHQHQVGNFDEIIKTAQNGSFDQKKLIDHLRKMRNASLTKRAGFLLEKFKGIDVFEEFTIDNNYVYLDKVRKASNKTNTKWRIKHDLNQ